MCACQKLYSQAAHFEIGPSSRRLFSARSSRESISRNAACQRTTWPIGWPVTLSELLRLDSGIYTGVLPRERPFSSVVASLGAAQTNPFPRAASDSGWEVRLLEGLMSALWASGHRGAVRPPAIVVAGGVKVAPSG